MKKIITIVVIVILSLVVIGESGYIYHLLTRDTITIYKTTVIKDRQGHGLVLHETDNGYIDYTIGTKVLDYK